MTDTRKVNQIYKWILEGASDFDVIEATHAAWPDQPIKHLLRAPYPNCRKTAASTPTPYSASVSPPLATCTAAWLKSAIFPAALRPVKQLRDLAAKHGTLREKETKPAD